MPEPTPDLSALSPTQRAALVRELTRRRAERAAPTGIPRRPADAPARLSVLQEQLWLVDQFEDDQAAAYNVATTVELDGPLDVPVLRAALAEVVRRHEALRTVVELREDVPHQRILPPWQPELVVEDRTGDSDTELRAEMVADAGRHIDLATGPVARFRLFRRAPGRHLLLLAVHHAFFDGWSLEVLLTELTALYRAYLAGQASPLPEPAVQYADFVAWQRERLESAGGGFERHLRYWEEQLRGMAVLNMPTDRPRPPLPSSRGDVYELRLDREVSDAARRLAGTHSATPFMVVMTAFAMTLARHTGQEDIVVGTSNAGRDRSELENVIGLFTNMNVLRYDLGGDPSFAELLGRVKQVIIGAKEHGEVPLAQVVDRMRMPRDLSRTPLFQVAMDMVPGSSAREAGELRLAYGPGLSAGLARFDMAVSAFDEAAGFRLSVEYATDLFDRATVRRLFDHLAVILAAGVAEPALTLSTVPMLSATELDQVLREWQGEIRDYPRELIHALVAAQAQRTPEAVALVYEGAEISYRDLDLRAGLLARYLRSVGVAPGESVGIGLERDIDMVVAVLGVLKAGAVFVPLDIEDPDLRRVFVLDDTEARFVLSRTDLPTPVPPGDPREVIELDRIWPAAEALAGQPLPEVSTLDSAAYVLYTSGSTGKPKGVVIEHHALATYIDFLGNVFDFGPGDRMLLLSALVFDLAEGELFTGLSRGATMVMVPRETTLSPPDLSEVLRRERVNYLGAPPAMIALLDPEPYPALRGMLVGGESFTGDLVNRWNLPGRLFLNAYGPTEATIGCTYHPCEHHHWPTTPPIGRAMPNRRVYLLDRFNTPVPIGVPGQITAAGPGLARGYLHDPDLTTQKFVPDPYHPGDRMYHTGDLGIWTPTGHIQFLGRIDKQVKLRGMRIEPGEIEAVIEARDGVEAAVVVLREDVPGDPRLVCYLVATPEALAGLRRELLQRLPLYMVPSAFVPMAELPLTPTGKVDRARLPAPDLAGRAGEWVAARTETERAIAEIFAEVLAVPKVGALDSFFDLGGNSLQAARVVARIRQGLDIQLRVRDFFDMPVVADLAADVDRTTEAAGDGTGADIDDEIAELERQLAAARAALGEQ